MKLHFTLLVVTIVTIAASCDCGRIDLGGGPEHDADEVSEGPWTPPIDNLGDQGWRDSGETWCAETGTEYELLGYDVWSDTSGVFLLAWYSYAVSGSHSCPSEDPACWTRNAIFHNDGSGWGIFWEDTTFGDAGGISAMSGIPESSLITLGGSYCSFRFITSGVATCQTLPYVHDVFAVNGNLLYALVNAEGDPNQKVLYYDGVTWGPLPVAFTPYLVEHLWADEENIFCSGPDGTIISLEDADWHIHDTRTIEDFNSVWGFSGTDVWTSTWSGELMHYDGETWNRVEWPCVDEDPEGGLSCGITEMWGIDGVLFFHTFNQLTMWDGADFTILAHWPSIFIRAIWGNSTEELFLAVWDENHPNPDCGIYYLLWWDGSEFHWF